MTKMLEKVANNTQPTKVKGTLKFGIKNLSDLVRIVQKSSGPQEKKKKKTN